MSGIGDNLDSAARNRQRGSPEHGDDSRRAGSGWGGVLARMGLHTRELRAWAMYDWAISGMQAVILASVFPIFFVRVAGSGMAETRVNEVWAYTNAAGAVAVALLSPILGAMADYAAAKKRFTALFMIVGVIGTCGMFFIHQGNLTLAVLTFLLSLLGSTASLTFYESLLPHIARPHEVDRVSAGGYALGYLGGGILLALCLAMIQFPGAFGLPSGEGLTPAQATLPSRLSFVAVGIWWLFFSIPLFLRVREPVRRLEADEAPEQNPARMAFVRLGETLRELRSYRQAFLMLVAFMIYNDGIQTIIKMAAVYGATLGIDETAMIGAILIVQFVGVPFAFGFGMLAGLIGAKRSVLIGIAVYAVITVLGYFMQTATHFFVLALLVGMVQGGTQAISRSLFASMVPPHKSGEFFGFYSVFEKFANIFGPLLFGLVITTTGSPRNAILSVMIFFIVGAILLHFVNVEEGQRVAREAEAHTREAPRGAQGATT